MFGQTEAPPTLAGLLFCTAFVVLAVVVIGVVSVLSDEQGEES